MVKSLVLIEVSFIVNGDAAMRSLMLKSRFELLGTGHDGSGNSAVCVMTVDADRPCCMLEEASDPFRLIVS